MVNGRLLKKVLLLDGNESCHYLNDTEQENFYKLITELTKAHLNVRYCTRDNCSCQPEYAIRRIIDSGGIKTMLCEEGLYEHIKKHVDTFQIKKEKGLD